MQRTKFNHNYKQTNEDTIAHLNKSSSHHEIGSFVTSKIDFELYPNDDYYALHGFDSMSSWL